MRTEVLNNPMLCVLLVVSVATCSTSAERSVDTPRVSVPGATPPAPAVAPVKTSADSAVDVVREYYRAIDEHRFNDAYLMWSDSGRVSGKSFAEFTRGFQETERTSVTTETPSRIEPAAGSRYITIPVTVDALTKSGVTQHFTGEYTLRRSVVDGAAADQRAWRIASARIAAQR